MCDINYQKRKNIELFENLEKSELAFSNGQNYIPIYNRFFNLNDTNYNSINLNNKHYISNIYEQIDDNIFECKLKNINNNKTKKQPLFFKIAPLLDPIKYLTGKYDLSDQTLFQLPVLGSTTTDCHSKLLDVNNSAYVDGMFLFLSSQLKNNTKFIHGVDYYCSFLGYKKNFKIDVLDDIDYLNNSEFFCKHKNELFQIDDYEYLLEPEEQKLKPINIGQNISFKSAKSIDNEMFDDIFDDTANNLNDNEASLETSTTEDMIECLSLDTFNINNLSNNSSNNSSTYINTNENEIDLHKETTCSLDISVKPKSISLKSSSTCSSRTSHTNENDLNDLSDENDDNSLDNNSLDDNKGSYSDHSSDYSGSSESSEQLNAIIPKFPVQLIGMEFCEDTFDNLITENELTTEEWFSALMQVIMTLITYQKVFHFTHNDLHTNNIMYNETDIKYLYYCYNNIYYKVPTYGRIFKIIDFGRSIFKYNGNIFCSDSFQLGGDAATQYNTEPYFNDKKPRLEPNFSFDLCRLACSIFDYVIHDFTEFDSLENIEDPIQRLIYEWCLDDKGLNMLYKNTGVERYPEFKLYKMIARCVHHHTPQAQLERLEFAEFSVSVKSIRNMNDVINIDKFDVQI